MDRIKIGVVGCGAVAQIQHLPNLKKLKDLFDVKIICDASKTLAADVSCLFDIEQHTNDIDKLLSSDIEAVLLCHTDPKVDAAMASFEAGKHVLIEKPVCFSLQEADKLIKAQQDASTVGMAAYMKVFDPAFNLVQQELSGMLPVRYAQINHLHTNNSHHLNNFNLLRAHDLDPQLLKKAEERRIDSALQALGDADDDTLDAFFRLSGSMIHDLYGARTLFGIPDRVASTTIWNEGWGIHTVLQYPEGFVCAATWVELSNIKDFKETLEISSDNERLLLSYPTGFSRGILSSLEIQCLSTDGTPIRSYPDIEWLSPFERELIHFHNCVTTGIKVMTPLNEIRHDIELIIEIIAARR
ncbi:MAG: Gfo/Idh/MocA family oxidoreductase [Candidatus Latescibacterota bacterium]|nr:Gfo/Idh/MocA family oxidoreductase [Candidatus Latescibacterota bacterium]